MKKLCYTDYVKLFTSIVEKIIISVLILTMSVMLLYTTCQLALHLYEALFMDGNGFNIDNTMELFGGFLLVLIGIELIDTIKIYMKDNIILRKIQLLPRTVNHVDRFDLVFVRIA